MIEPMSGYIPEHKIDEVRAAADIVEVISTFVSLKKAGVVYRGLCPFHMEKTPSFTVNPQRKIFHCFGCGVGGNVFRFVMLQKGITFPEAVAELAERYGIDLPRVDPGRYRVEKQTKAGLYQAVDLAMKFFEDELAGPSGRRTREYLANRGISPEVSRRFHLGWAPPGWDNLRRFLESRGISREIMETAGLVRARTDGRNCYDTFRSRVICPIFDLDGKVVAFGGRVLQETEQQPKYMNSPDTPIYHKGRLLYGLDRCRDQLKTHKAVFIVEGYFDLLSLVAHGVGHVVATLGTALTSAHLRLLKGYVNQAVLMFDPDEAGRAAAARALPLFLSADLEGRVLVLPQGHDPDTFVRTYGPEALETALAGAGGLLDFYLDQTLSRYPDTLAGKSRAVQEILAVLSSVDGEARQALVRQAVAGRIGLSEDALRLTERRRESGPEDYQAPVEGLAADFETEMLRLILQHPEIKDMVFQADLSSHFTDETARRVYDALARQYFKTGGIEPDRILEELTPEDSNMAAGLLISENGLREDDVSTVTQDYIERFLERSRRSKSLELSRRIKEAQQSADFASLTALIEEKNKLMKENHRAGIKGRVQ